jgi:hypothetical protein
MTEDEAKKKWCPMVRTNYYGDGTNRSGTGYDVVAVNCCIGSDCMMWVETAPHDIKPLSNTGYCGLAGWHD